MSPKTDLGGVSPQEYCKASGCDLRKFKCGCEVITLNHHTYEYWVTHVVYECPNHFDFWHAGKSYSLS